MSEQQESMKKKTLKSSSRSFLFSTGLQSLVLSQIILRLQQLSIRKKQLLSVFSYSDDTFLAHPGLSGILGSGGKQNTA